ncbi:MAG: cytidylate kinase-like family protein [Proteobacteria bacterium]|nr:cytidylate kinase-like family protein [Pseudomonadota bacterium]MBU1610414.1 cytidylate kinase-like family protein [Pseudomonadota bacterium]
MSIITVSRDSYSHGAEIAKKVAQELGYECIGSDSVVQSVQDKLNEPFGLLKSSIEVNKTISAVASRKDMAYYRSAFYDTMLSDNVVYHGLAGHLFLSEIPNVIKVRLVADMEDRVSEMVRRIKISPEEAQRRIRIEDAKRHELDSSLGTATDENSSFDMSVNLHNMDVDRAAQIIVDAARILKTESAESMQSVLSDLALASHIEIALLDKFSDVRANVRDGRAYIQVEASIVQEEAAARMAMRILADIEGIQEAHVGVMASSFVPF